VVRLAVAVWEAEICGHAWLAQMRRRGVGDGAIRCRVSALKAACSWGVSRRMLRSNPVADAAPRLSTGRRSVTPTPEQVVALLQAAAAEDARAGLGLRIAAVPGAREAEIVALAWSDLTGAVLRIGRQRHSMDGQVLLRDRTKTGRDRSVLLDAGTVTAILTWKAKVEELVGAPTAWMLSEPGAADPPSPPASTAHRPEAPVTAAARPRRWQPGLDRRRSDAADEISRRRMRRLGRRSGPPIMKG